MCYTALFDRAFFRGGDAGRDALEGLGAAAPAEEGLWLEVPGSPVETTASIQIADTGCCVGEIARGLCAAGTFGVSPAVPSDVKLCTARAVVGSGEGLDAEMRVAWASSAGRMSVAPSITGGLCSSRIRSAASVGFP